VIACYHCLSSGTCDIVHYKKPLFDAALEAFCHSLHGGTERVFKGSTIKIQWHVFVFPLFSSTKLIGIATI